MSTPQPPAAPSSSAQEPEAAPEAPSFKYFRAPTSAQQPRRMSVLPLRSSLPHTLTPPASAAPLVGRRQPSFLTTTSSPPSPTSARSRRPSPPAATPSKTRPSGPPPCARPRTSGARRAGPPCVPRTRTLTLLPPYAHRPAGLTRAADDDQDQVHGRDGAREDVPLDRQDPRRVRVRARLPARGRQGGQVRPLCVPARPLPRLTRSRTLTLVRARRPAAPGRVQGLRPQGARQVPRRARLRALLRPPHQIRRRRVQPYVRVPLRARSVSHRRLADPNVPPPLDPSVLAVIEDYPTPPSFDDQPPAPKQGAPGGGKTLGNLLGKKDGDGERKLPKWLKLGPSTYSLTHLLTPTIDGYPCPIE